MDSVVGYYFAVGDWDDYSCGNLFAFLALDFDRYWFGLMVMSQQNEINLGPGDGASDTPDYLLDTTAAELLADSSPHQRSALGLLAISHCYDLPLAPMLGRLGGEASGIFSRQVIYLASLVDRGEHPLKAIEDLDRVLSPSSLLALQVAHDNGTLSQLYRAVLRRPPELDSDADAQREIDARFSRLMMRAFFVMLIVIFTALKIFPELEFLIRDFDLEAPLAMLYVYLVLNLAAKFWFIWVLLLILLGCWLAPRYLRRWNPVAWRKTVSPKSALRRQSLAVVAQNSDASKTGFNRIASFLPIRKLFPQLAKSSALDEAGNASWESLASQGVITKREADTLAGTHSGQTQAWLLRWSAKALGDRVRLKSSWGFNLVIWIGNIVLAGIVFAMCLTVFSTLLTIMRGI